MKLIETPEVKASMKRVAAALKPWRWCLIGGRAVEVYSNPPQTPDIDVLVLVPPDEKGKLLAAIKKQGFKLEARLDDDEDDGEFPMLFFKDKNGVELDAIGAFEDIHFWAIESAKKHKVGGVLIPVATAENVVVLKAQALLSRDSSERKARDRAAILAVAEANTLDTDYIATILSEASADMTEEVQLLKDLDIL